MELKERFFDTYAFHEIAVGNPAYRDFAGTALVLTTQLHLIELYCTFLVRYGQETAEFYYHLYKPCCVEIEDAVVKEAMSFKAANKKKNLSYADCIGYAVAKFLDVPFLTGDKQFKGMENVDFRK